MKLLIDRIPSPMGTIQLISDGSSLCALDFADCEARMLGLLHKRYPACELVGTIDPLGLSTKIRAYLSGDFRSLDNIPVNGGGTEFQQQVWQMLKTIPSGTTATAPDRSTELVERLLKLPEQTRLDLANLLLDSVRQGFTSLAEAEKRDKDLIRTRLEELVSGKVELLDPADVFAEMRRRVAEVRKK